MNKNNISSEEFNKIRKYLDKLAVEDKKKDKKSTLYSRFKNNLKKVKFDSTTKVLLAAIVGGGGIAYLKSRHGKIKDRSKVRSDATAAGSNAYKSLLNKNKKMDDAIAKSRQSTSQAAGVNAYKNLSLKSKEIENLINNVKRFKNIKPDINPETVLSNPRSKLDVYDKPKLGPISPYNLKHNSIKEILPLLLKMPMYRKNKVIEPRIEPIPPDKPIYLPGIYRSIAKESK